MIKTINKIFSFNYSDKIAFRCINPNHSANITFNVCRLKNNNVIQSRFIFGLCQSKKMHFMMSRVKNVRVNFDKSSSKPIMVQHYWAIQLMKQQKYIQAIKLEQQIIELHKQIYGQICQEQKQVQNRILLMTSLLEMYKKSQQIDKVCKLIEEIFNYQVENKLIKNQNVVQTLSNYFHFGNNQMQLKNYEKAQLIYEYGLGFSNKWVNELKNIFDIKVCFYYNKAQCQMTLGQYKKSLQIFQDMINLSCKQIKKQIIIQEMQSRLNLAYQAFETILHFLLPEVKDEVSKFIRKFINMLSHNDIKFIGMIFRLMLNYPRPSQWYDVKSKQICFKIIDKYQYNSSVSNELIPFYMTISQHYQRDNKVLCSKYLMTRAQIILENPEMKPQIYLI